MRERLGREASVEAVFSPDVAAEAAFDTARLSRLAKEKDRSFGAVLASVRRRLGVEGARDTKASGIYDRKLT
jgi:hypothetical protein